MRRDDLIQRLADSENPSIRWNVRVGVLDEDPTSRGIKRLQQEIRESPVVAALLARRHDGQIHARYNGDYVNPGSGRKAMNEWITADALSVLHAAGRR